MYFKVQVKATLSEVQKKVGKNGESITETKDVRKTMDYLVDAMSVTESEAKMRASIPNNWKDVDVVSSNPSNVLEINPGDDEDVQWWLVRFVEHQENDNGKTKSVTTYEMFQGNDIHEAIKISSKKYGSDSIADVEVRGITDTKIMVEEELV